MHTYQTEFVIRRNNSSVKLLRASANRATLLMRRIQSRYPAFQWSIAPRFPIYGSD